MATLLVRTGVLFPNERVRSDVEQTIFVVLAQRSKLDQLAREQRLQIEGHCCGIIAEFQPKAMCAENVHVPHLGSSRISRMSLHGPTCDVL